MTPFQSTCGNRIVVMNCNRIRDELNHSKVKDDVWTLLGDDGQHVLNSSFFKVSFLLKLILIK